MVDGKKQIKDLSAEEFSELVSKTHFGNYVEIGGVVVQASDSSLKEVEDCANRLLKKWNNFLLMRKEILIKTGGGNLSE